MARAAAEYHVATAHVRAHRRANLPGLRAVGRDGASVAMRHTRSLNASKCQSSIIATHKHATRSDLYVAVAVSETSCLRPSVCSLVLISMALRVYTAAHDEA